MLRLLLDEHISPEIAVAVARRCKGLRIVSIHTWLDGAFLGAPDPDILLEAAKEQMTLVTYDQRTMWGHIKTLADMELNHSGVLFIDERTIPPNDLGRLIRALCWLWEERGGEVWLNRTIFLTPSLKK